MISRTTRVNWEPGKGGGGGTIHPESQAFSAPYSRNSRFESAPGTNAEELLAAALASCFSMALAGALSAAGHQPQGMESAATVQLDRDDTGYKVVRIDLETAVSAEGLEDGLFQEKAAEAKANCPMSKALRAVDIFLEAKLV